MFPSFEKLIAVIFTVVLGLCAIGRPDLVWKGIAQMRYHALREVSKPWGCPSVFNKGACDSYDPRKYK